jgi:opacity protein-like surface antigen
MKRTLTGTALAVLASAVFAAAQAQSPNPSDRPSSPPQPPASQSQPSSRSSDQDKTMTWTGCLEAGTVAGTYVLSNASASGSAQTPTKAPETAGAAAAGDKFVLSGAPASFNISSHVNHKVEITGTASDMAAAGGAQSKAGQMASADTPTRTITVKSAKMVSDRCTTF